MGKGPAWEYAEIVDVRNNRVKCRQCGHVFTGGATRICEHLFGVGRNVSKCANAPPSIWQTLSRYASKQNLRARQSSQRSVACDDATINITERTEEAAGNDTPSFSMHTDVQTESVPSTSYQSGCKRRKSFESGTIEHALGRQDMQELHIKWTQAFVACGIPFNAIRNPHFQDALLSSVRNGKGFVLPDYNKMRTEYLDKLKNTVQTSLTRTIFEYIPTLGCTIAIDGWTSCQKKPLINIMCICPRGSVFLEAIDTSLRQKTSSYIEKIYERAIASVGGSKNVTAIVSDNAANYKSAGLAIQTKYPEITWVPCAAHTLNLLLKDLGKLSFIQPVLLESNAIIKFIREHHYTHALFRSKSEYALKIFCATRFATSYYVLERLWTVRASLLETVADRRWDAWVSKYPQFLENAKKVVYSVHSAPFWRNVEKIINVVQPFVNILRMVDSEKFIMGRVYWSMSEAIRMIKETDTFTNRDRLQMVHLATERWTQMHTPLHGAAFALDPKFQLHHQSSNVEVMKNFKSVCNQILGGQQGKIAYFQRLTFANREGNFGDTWVIDAVDTFSAPMWWKEFGFETLELQCLAIKVLSVAASSGSCERNWAAFDFIHTKRRNRLRAKRAADLVYVFSNMRLLSRTNNLAREAIQTNKKSTTQSILQTTDNVAEECQSDDEDEWEVVSNVSDMDEMDDIVPVLAEDE